MRLQPRILKLEKHFDLQPANIFGLQQEGSDLVCVCTRPQRKCKFDDLTFTVMPVAQFNAQHPAATSIYIRTDADGKPQTTTTGRQDFLTASAVARSWFLLMEAITADAGKGLSQ